MKQSHTFPRLLALAILAVFAAACTQAAPTAAPTAAQPTVAQPTAAPTEPATLAPTSTTAPTATTAPTDTPVPPTDTPEPTVAPTLGTLEDGLSAWCLPTGMLSTLFTDPAAPPQNAVFGAASAQGFEINSLPQTACTFIYTFNQEVTPGMKLQVFGLDQAAPWLTADLVPVESAPDSAAAQLSHTYITQPPFWDVSYDFVVVGEDGSEIRRDRVNLHRWKPKLCWNGQLPNLNTMLCPEMQDLHPWDPSYETPFPTPGWDDEG